MFCIYFSDLDCLNFLQNHFQFLFYFDIFKTDINNAQHRMLYIGVPSVVNRSTSFIYVSVACS